MSENVDFRAAIAIFNIDWACASNQVPLDDRQFPGYRSAERPTALQNVQPPDFHRSPTAR